MENEKKLSEIYEFTSSPVLTDLQNTKKIDVVLLFIEIKLYIVAII